MGDFDAYLGLALRGGFLLKSIVSKDAPMTDALNRHALARTVITAMTFEMNISSQLSPEEISVTLYHEILEAAAIASADPPSSVCQLNEAGFESAAQQMHVNLGMVTPAKLNQMLELFGF